MATKAVATEADVQVVASTSFPIDKADSGTWTAGPVLVKQDAKVTIAGAPAIYEARCTFTLAGMKGTTAVAATEDVVLTATQTKLQSQHHVLRDGDTKQSPYGNTVKIVSTRKLRSS